MRSCLKPKMRQEIFASNESNAMRLSRKKAIITGSSSGIGRGVAKAFAEEGASHIVINYPGEAEQEKARAACAEVHELGCKAIAVEADLSSPDAIDHLVDEARAFMGDIDVLVNNAGIAPASPIEDLEVGIWDTVIAVNLRSVFLMTKTILPLMYERNFGRIINTASQLAYAGSPGLCAYSASKGGIISLTRSVALEVGERNIRINCVAPGATETPILEKVPPEIIDQVRAGIPVGKLAVVKQIAPSYVFLASSDGDHFQGQCISPNGGDVFL